LTPNQVKAILQYTAHWNTSYDYLTQGAGFLNAKGAVELARHLRNPFTVAYPDYSGWSRRIIWGNFSVRSGRLTADANAWSPDVTWGAASTPTGQIVEWGIACSTTSCETPVGAWSISDANLRNVVWGTTCAGADCDVPWSLAAVTGTSDGDTVVWGTTDDGETVVWGTSEDAETVVWGTSDSADTVVWGTSCEHVICLPTIWRP
jgi:hypothetical protein